MIDCFSFVQWIEIPCSAQELNVAFNTVDYHSHCDVWQPLLTIFT